MCSLWKGQNKNKYLVCFVLYSIKLIHDLLFNILTEMFSFLFVFGWKSSYTNLVLYYFIFFLTTFSLARKLNLEFFLTELGKGSSFVDFPSYSFLKPLFSKYLHVAKIRENVMILFQSIEHRDWNTLQIFNELFK